MKASLFPEVRRNSFEPPAHAMCFCAATVTAVAGVAAAGTAAYSSYSQGKATKDQQAALSGNAEAAYGSKVELPDYEDNVRLTPYNPRAGAEDYQAVLPLLGAIAGSATKGSMMIRDGLTGGMASANLNQAGSNISALLKGYVPGDVTGVVNRLVAERGAGAFSPGGGAQQMAQADFARSIGKTSMEMMQLGMSYAPQWETLVDAFTYKPQQAMNDALAAMRERHSHMFNTATVQLEKDQRKYLSEVNKEKAKSMPNPQFVGSFRDNMALGAQSAQQQQNMINALIGTVNSAAGAYSTIMSPQSVPTYSSSSTALAAAPYASSASSIPGMGYVPRATRV